MAISTLAQYHAAPKQIVSLAKTTPSGNSASPIWISSAMTGGAPLALAAISNTTTGVVPASPMTGAPTISPFSGTGYITGVRFASDWAGRIILYDRLFHAGAFAASVGVTSLSGQPSYSSRVPGGTDYTGTQIWIEAVVGGGGSANLNTMRVQYTNQAGAAGHVTGTAQKQNNVAASCVQLPLAAGDTGVQAIENFEVVTSSSNATWNVFVVRPLWTGRLPYDKRNIYHWLDLTGMPQVWADSCLCCLQSFDVNEPRVDMEIEIASA